MPGPDLANAPGRPGNMSPTPADAGTDSWLAIGRMEAIALRTTWVNAVEAASTLNSSRELLTWMDWFVRPILGYDMIACGTGSFAAAHFAADRLLIRGFPILYVESLRGIDGVVSLPRASHGQRAALAVLDLQAFHGGPAQWRVDVERFGLGVLAAHDRRDVVVHSGSYFLFGQLDRPPGPQQHYLLELLGPHMHEALARTLEHDPRLQPAAQAPVALTRRESELLAELLDGRTTAEIAHRAHRSAHTVNNQVRNIMRKLNAKNRSEAIAIAIGLGLIRPRAISATRVVAAQVRAAYTFGKPASPVRRPKRLPTVSAAVCVSTAQRA